MEPKTAKKKTLNATTHAYMYAESASNMQTPLTISGFHLQFADSTYKLRIPFTVCGFRVLGVCLWNPKKPRRSKKCSNVADSATNLIRAGC